MDAITALLAVVFVTSGWLIMVAIPSMLAGWMASLGSHAVLLRVITILALAIWILSLLYTFRPKKGAGRLLVGVIALWLSIMTITFYVTYHL